MNKIVSLAAAYAALSVGTFFVGLYLGKMQATNSASKTSAAFHLARHFKSDTISAENVVLHVDVGAYRYVYDLLKNKVEGGPLPLDVLLRMEVPKKWSEADSKDFEALIKNLGGGSLLTAGTLGGLYQLHNIAYLETTTKFERWGAYGAALVLGAGAGILGYNVGHSTEANVESDVFERTITDATTWRGWATHLKTCHTRKMPPDIRMATKATLEVAEAKILEARSKQFTQDLLLGMDAKPPPPQISAHTNSVADATPAISQNDDKVLVAFVTECDNMMKKIAQRS